MGDTKVYSERLGAISDAQFEAVAERLKLGRFVKAEPTSSGLFGQNVFVTTTKAEFVLRGAPHWVKDAGETQWRRDDRAQFTKERWYAQQLHEHTKAPVPWPMLHDEADDIFGWPYLVMPRMPGLCTDERGILTALASEDRHGVAVALGEALAEMQRLTWTFAGDFGSGLALQPFPGGYTRHVIAQMDEVLRGTPLSDAEKNWVADAQALAVPSAARPNSFVHGDYKFANLTVMAIDGKWRVSGLFDLHTAHFGDGALDLARQACAYLDTEPALARVFLDAYRAAMPPDPTLGERLPLYVLCDRLIIWSYFARPGAEVPWLQGKNFRGWSEPYVDAIRRLL